jgi:hypothetical protein
LGFGLPPAARVALTSARDAALRSACAWDGVWLGVELAVAPLPGALDDDVVAVERDASPDRLLEPLEAVPYPPEGVNRPAP